MVIPMKTIPLDKKTSRMVETLSALSNPARLQILEILAEQPASIVADIVARLPLAQATVSQHLKVLQEARLIHDERAGAGRCCRVDFVELLGFAEALTQWTHRLASAVLANPAAGGPPCRPS
jgi:DNA-binding transcriptional ArsR family regulator